MKIDGAKSMGNGKWLAELACGHTVLCDASVDSPARELKCPVCEVEDE